MPKGSSLYSPGADKQVNQSRQVVKCGSDDSGQDASWKPDDDEMAGEMDDDEDVTSDGKSTPEEEDATKSRNERRHEIPPKRGIDRKGGSARRSCPTPNQDWKDSRKSMKGLRELAALIDGSAQLHESKTRTRRQTVPTQRKFQNGNGHDRRLDGEYASCSSGDSSWSNRSGSSILGGSPRNERSRMEPLKPAFRSPVKLQERPHGSHINNGFDHSMCTPQKVLSKSFSGKMNTSRTLDDCPATTSGRSVIHPDEPSPNFKSCNAQMDPLQDANPSKRQRIGSPTQDGDQGASRQLVNNIDDIGERWRAEMLDIGQEDPKVRIANCNQHGDGDGTSKRSHSGSKIKKTPMIKHENAWYRARILKNDSESGKLFVEFTGFEDGLLSKPFWIREDSERIWRGSYRGKDWKHLGDGAWKPKPPPSMKIKKKFKGVRRGKKSGQPDTEQQVSQQVVTHVKDSTDQMVSQGDGTNMETDDMGPHHNSNNDGEGANVGTSRDAREANEVTQKLTPVEVKREAPNPSPRGPKLPKLPRRSAVPDTHPGNRDSGTYPQAANPSLEPNDGANFLTSRPSHGEDYESQNRHTDGPSESGVSLDRKGEKRACNRSEQATNDRHLERDQMGKIKNSLGVLSEGVGSAGDSQGSQVCPLKKSHLKLRNGGPYDDTVYSSPSSESPLSHVKSVIKGRKGNNGTKQDNFDASEKNEPVDHRDSLHETADAGKLGWKIGWKRHVKSEQRSSDDHEDPEDLDANLRQATPIASSSLPRVDAALKPAFPSLVNSNSDYLRSRKAVDEDQSCQEEAKPLQYGRGSESDKGVAGKRSSKRSDRNRTSAKLRSKHAADDELNTEQDALMKVEPALTPSFPKARSTFAHIRKHLPYYNEHIPDQKLEAFVEMMERLDAVPDANPSVDSTVRSGSGNYSENCTPGTSKQPQQTMGQPASGPNHQLNHFVPIPLAQPQGQSQNVQVPLPWAAISPLFYPSVMQFPLSSTWPHQNQQPHLQVQQVARTPDSQPSLKLNQHRGVSSGNRGR